MGLLKSLRSKMRRHTRGKVPLSIQGQSPEDLFLWRCFNLGFTRDPLIVSVNCWRRVFPQEPLGSKLSRVWLRGPFQPDDVVQIAPDFSPNIGGAFMIVNDCGDENIFGYILLPAKDGRAEFEITVPRRQVRKVGTAWWKSARLRLAGAQA